MVTSRGALSPALRNHYDCLTCLDEASDYRWMGHALILAERAAAEGEVPVGAVLVVRGRAIGEGWNRPIASHDPTAHAEIVAIRAAAQTLGNYRITGSTLYVTLEPCLMCAGAMLHARVNRLVFGAPDLKRGAVQSTATAFETPGLNHRLDVTGGVRGDECAQRLQAFFRARRE